MTTIVDAVALVVCALAVGSDLRTRRIPNWLTVSAGAAGLLLGAGFGAMSAGVAGALHGLLGATAAGVLGLVVFGVPAAFGLVGMGDVKLVAALGSLLGLPVALPLALYIALAGGAVAAVYALASRRLAAVARNVSRIRSRELVLHRMPYSLAIALGCAWTIAAGQVEALRLIG